MSEYIEALRRDYPAIDDMLEQYGDSSLAEYLGRIGHRELPEILPSEDLLEAVESHLTPFFGRETASRAAAVLGRQRCLSTANHHHFSFDYSTVQDTLLYEQWLRKRGETEGIVPIFAAANVHLQNSAFPRGILIYDCGLPEKKLKLPLFPHKMKHTCVAGIGGVDSSMVQAARTRLRQVKENGTIGLAMYHAISEFYETIVMSDAAQGCGSYRAQTTVVNEQLSRRYFTDRSPRYLWMPMEDITSELLQKDLRQEEGLLNRLLFHPPLRACLMGQLDGVSGCWTGSSAGTHFFWGLDGRGVLFAMHLETAQGETLLTGTDSAGGAVTVPFAAGPVCEHLRRRTLLPSLFLIFLELYFLRDYTVFGGYYQPTYLKKMQTGLVQALGELGLFRREAEILREKVSHLTLGPTYLLRDRGDGPYRVSTAELLEEPISTAELEEALEMSVLDSYEMLIP